MTTIAPAPLEYANPAAGKCPICNDRPATHKTLYGHAVCKKCLYAFANRRQFAYLIDTILFSVVGGGLAVLITAFVASSSMSGALIEVVTIAFALVLQAAFAIKDGFNGQSPGKRATGVQVVDERSGEPISFRQSFKRNAIFLIGVLPWVGPLASLAILIIIIVQMTKGHRLGDRFAGTRVIWKKHADSPVFGGDDMRCHSCGYNLTGNESGLCPECGTPASPQQLVAAPAAVL